MADNRHMGMITFEKGWSKRKILTVLLVAFALSFLLPPLGAFDFNGSQKEWVKRFRAELFSGAHDKQTTSALTQRVCENIRAELKDGLSLQEGIQLIDSVIKQTGARISSNHAIIRRGFIVYYFQPDDKNIPLINVELKTETAFSNHHIGSTYSWLNPRWYAENNRSDASQMMKRAVQISGEDITIKFETVSPLLDDFLHQGVVNVPPPHILAAATEAGLTFLKSERRDEFGYAYSIDLREWYQAVLGVKKYFNINVNVLAKRDKDGTLSDLKIAAGCSYPYMALLYARPGYPPSNKTTEIMQPVTIPSCWEYSSWYRCQNSPKTKNCDRITKEPPVCPQDAMNFPRSDYF